MHTLNEKVMGMCKHRKMAGSSAQSVAVVSDQLPREAMTHDVALMTEQRGCFVIGMSSRRTLTYSQAKHKNTHSEEKPENLGWNLIEHMIHPV